MEKKFFILKRILIFLSILITLFISLKLFMFYIPFVIAYITSIILNPIINKLCSKFEISRKISSIIILTAFFLITIILIFFGITKLIEESSFLSSTLATYIEKIIEYINSFENNKFLSENILKNETTRNIIQRNINDFLNSFEKGFKNILTSLVNNLKLLPIYFINLIITILSLYFLLADKFSILDKLEHQFSKKLVSKIRIKVEKISKTLTNYLKAEIILIIISFSLVLIGLYIFKLIGMNVEYPLLMAIFIGIVDALPILGAGIVMIPWSIILFINKDNSLGFSVLGLFILILCIKQILEPKLVSQKIGVHPFFTLIAMYTGFKLLGFIGILIGPILLIILKEIFDNFLDKGLINYFIE